MFLSAIFKYIYGLFYSNKKTEESTSQKETTAGCPFAKMGETLGMSNPHTMPTAEDQPQVVKVTETKKTM